MIYTASHKPNTIGEICCCQLLNFVQSSPLQSSPLSPVISDTQCSCVYVCVCLESLPGKEGGRERVHCTWSQ